MNWRIVKYAAQPKKMRRFVRNHHHQRPVSLHVNHMIKASSGSVANCIYISRKMCNELVTRNVGRVLSSLIFNRLKKILAKLFTYHHQTYFLSVMLLQNVSNIHCDIKSQGE